MWTVPPLIDMQCFMLKDMLCFIVYHWIRIRVWLILYSANMLMCAFNVSHIRQYQHAYFFHPQNNMDFVAPFTIFRISYDLHLMNLNITFRTVELPGYERTTLFPRGVLLSTGRESCLVRGLVLVEWRPDRDGHGLTASITTFGAT